VTTSRYSEHVGNDTGVITTNDVRSTKVSIQLSYVDRNVIDNEMRDYVRSTPQIGASGRWVQLVFGLEPTEKGSHQCPNG